MPSFYETDSASSSSQNSRSSGSKKLTQKLKKFSSFISKKIKLTLSPHASTDTTALERPFDDDQERQQVRNHFRKRHSSYIASTPSPSIATPRSYFSSIDLKKSVYNKDSLKEQCFSDKKNDHHNSDMLLSSLSPPPRAQISKSKSTVIYGSISTSGSNSSGGGGGGVVEASASVFKPGLCRSNTLGTYYQYYHQYHRLGDFSNTSIYEPTNASSSNYNMSQDDCHSSLSSSTTSLTQGPLATQVFL